MKTLFIIITLFCATVCAAQSLDVVPLVEDVRFSEGTFRAERVKIKGAQSAELSYLKESLKSMGVQMDSRGKNIIELTIDPRMKGTQGYRIDVAKNRVVVTAYANAGLFYGVITLLQMLEKGAVVQCCTVSDSPRYDWRGFMVDESRHFFGKDKIKQTLDMMARYKLNKFHWHLTDAPSWRIEIKKYPRLTSVGSIGSWSDPNSAASFYTQDDIREIVAYAAARHIEIIPEIDMPGHATAANRAYPQFSGGGVPAYPEFTFNPGKEEVYKYLTDILREVAELFPSRYLHIGGDEVWFAIKAWESDPAVKALMQREKMTDVRQAERYFIHRMTDTINMLGKQLIGWDELIEVDAKPQTTTIMWWRHDKADVLNKSLNMGYKTILCPRLPLYFDFIQNPDHLWGRISKGCTLEDVYSFPDSGLDKWGFATDNVIGIQANLWSERIKTMERYDYMTYPRLCALAESAWSLPKGKSYEDFTRRMEKEYRYMDKLGLYYYDARDPQRRVEAVGCGEPRAKVVD